MSIKHKSVAVILPVYNSETTLLQAVESVLNQTYPWFQLYVIDDGSKDGSIELLKSIKDDRLHIMNNIKNIGVACTRNKGIDESIEPFISFIDADDVWKNNKLEKQLALMDEYDIVSSSYNYMKRGRIFNIMAPRSMTKEQIIKKEYRLCFSSILFKRRIMNDLRFEKIGHEDLAFIYKLMCVSKKQEIGFVKEPLVDYLVQENSLSAQKKKAAAWHWNVLRNSLKFSLLKSLWLFMCYFFRALMFKCKTSSRI